MKFKKVNKLPSKEISSWFLVEDHWDDWGKYCTQFSLIYFDAKGKSIECGNVKISQKNLKPGSSVSSEPGAIRKPLVPDSFDTLSDEYFSIGQDENYYEQIYKIDSSGETFLALKDCAYDLSIFRKYKHEYSMGESLLRFIESERVEQRFNRLAHGNAVLSQFDFKYTYPLSTGNQSIEFNVIPESFPASNIHVVIGRNGVGKTHLIRNMIKCIILGNNKNRQGHLIRTSKKKWGFANIIFISFSAFDELPPLPANKKVRYEEITLQKRMNIPENKDICPEDLDEDTSIMPSDSDSEVSSEPKSEMPPISVTKNREELTVEFVKSIERCYKKNLYTLWKSIVFELYSENIFRDADIISKIDNENISNTQFIENVVSVFKKLSSGHAILLLTLTRCVELIQAQSLIFLDEPEGHLHPPLLAAFIQGLSQLLLKKNAVCILATHSPVVLQEIPKSCVWIITRSNKTVVAKRPNIETFGENTGILTREVFGLEVDKTGFHKIIFDLLKNGNDFNTIIQKFNNTLGSEARAIGLGLLANMQEDK